MEAINESAVCIISKNVFFRADHTFRNGFRTLRMVVQIGLHVFCISEQRTQSQAKSSSSLIREEEREAKNYCNPSKWCPLHPLEMKVRSSILMWSLWKKGTYMSTQW